ncbi:MAG: hypothetical protein AAB676_06560 [Verrucomicrobiota bacterium]
MELLWDFIEQNIPGASSGRLESRGALARLHVSSAAQYAQVHGVRALMYLSEHVKDLMPDRQQLLDAAISWILTSRVTWNIRFRSLVLVSSLAALEPLRSKYNWRAHGKLLDALKPFPPPIGLAWLIPVRILFDDDIASIDWAKSLRQAYFEGLDPEGLEHPVLNVAEGTRTVLISTWQLGDASAKELISRRIPCVLSWLDFSYYDRLREQTRENQLRLLLSFAALRQCQKILSDLTWPSRCGDFVEKLKTLLATELLGRIRNPNIRHVANLLEQAASRTDQEPWHSESAQLHCLDAWERSGRLAWLRDVLIEFYKVMVHERDRRGGAGLTSWKEVMNPFGLVVPDAEVNNLAKEVDAQFIPAVG